MISEEEFLRKELIHIDWARRNGMSATIYDDFVGVFRRRLKVISQEDEKVNNQIMTEDACGSGSDESLKQGSDKTLPSESDTDNHGKANRGKN